jgi:hypothetical protein
MERELWPPLYHALRTVAKDFHQKYVSYQPWVLVAILLWAALHDRPVSWACQARHWSTTKLRPMRLPSRSVLSRRLDKLPVGALLHALEQYLRDRQQRGLLAFLDGKPLPVSGVSKDKDAGFGRGAGCKAKGYKLHTFWANRVLPEAWDVTALNEAETKVAERLLRQAPGGGYVLGDGNYDANAVFDAAGESGYQLLTPMPATNAGKGHHYQSPYRLGCIERMRSDFGTTLYGARGGIERRYGHAVSFGGGLGPLPAWVRGRERVRSWVWAKLLINAVRLLRNHGLTT